MKAVLYIVVLVLAGSAWIVSSGCGGTNDDSDSSESSDSDDDDDSGTDDDDDDNDDTSPGRADIVLPPYPFWPNDAFVVNEVFMEDLATVYCAAHPDFASAQEFFMGALPMESFDLVYNDQPPVGPSMLMGDLYISGYFGGLWLRDVLNPPRTKDNDDDEFASLRVPFELMAQWVAEQLTVAANGADSDVIEAARGQVIMLLALYGYNLGYLEQIIEHPPAGIEPPTEKLSCHEDQLLDCDSPSLPWPFLERYADSIVNLREPPNDAWAQLAEMTENAEFFVEQGRRVWQFIPLDNLTVEGYALLIDLSVYFLMASKAAALGAMTSWADALPQEGRFALLVSAGMVSWGGSYFLGLASPASSDGFPILTCPE